MKWTDQAIQRIGGDLKQSRADRFFRLLDYRMLVPVLALVIIGLTVLNSVLSKGYGAVIFDYPMNFYKQMAAVLLGLVAAFILCLFEPPAMRLIGGVVYFVSLILLLVVKIDGYRPVAGADSWIRIPLFGSFQPSELAKIGAAMMTGPVFAAMKRGELSAGRGFLRIGLLYGVPLLFIVTEPDLGTSLVLIFMFICTTFVWGVRWRTIILTMAGTIFVILPLSWQFIFNPAQKERVMTFLFRGYDKSASYHIEQSLAAITSGGLAGNRTGATVSVPVKESDFIFTAISEQLGLIGTSLVILLAIYFIAHTLRVAGRVVERSPDESYIMVALIAGVAFHFIENIGMTVGLLPITGIPLPFISYGGSAMISNFLLLGVLLNYSLNHTATLSP
ncbi:MAG TPA: FtsW/RodA/SpoVE family cell cycle protein [Bacillota bacterium]|jgi:rod shape determining protein RodA|nr:FtsW/RodA/SpoVE family cell cycle protein [Fastidiosipila sp.]HPX92923.1 FtsW/RodA/SpoVE family cell cycle protein [Bacillota bacterium]HQB80687.1 FtsW/RodA/SpoVE family cell cycle protein [Bacillota bacterium]